MAAAARQPSGSTDRGVLERNLRALAIASPRTAELVARASASPVEFEHAADGALTGTLDGRALASRRSPLDEADRFAAAIDPGEHGGVVVLGFGLGHHVGACAARLGGAGVLLCFEPDVGLLRAVLERIDHSAWLGRGGVAVLTDADDGAAVAGATRGVEGLLTVGVRILAHQPSAARLGDAGPRFAERVATALRAMRTNVVTTLLQSEVTLRNLLMNADRYARGAGVGELEGAARGRPALVVSAGPSLAASLDELARADPRERAVVIAVQTALKPMLRRGVRPHYVVAIDYHEISARFYEGLTASDVEGVTLIADPKCNPVILESFPGAIRTVHDATMAKLLGALNAHDAAALPSGATVAHLAYSLARHMGCDPVVMIGQDLAFAGGLYYGPGAAIHEAWAGELNEFNTPEALEWQRIARMRCQLRRVPDHRGATVYTDEQMATYLVQFEQMFTADAARGLTTIDTAERGAARQGVRVMPLREAMADWPTPGSLRLPPPPPIAPPDSRELTRHARRLADDARRVAQLSDEALGVLRRMADLGDDSRAVDALVPRAHAIGARARSIQPAYQLAHFLNQAGALRRYRADRAIDIADAGATRQQRQIARDADNVRWLADAARLLATLADEAAEAMASGVKRTRTPEPDVGGAADGRAGAMRRIAAIVTADPEFSGLGARRDLAAPVHRGRNALQITLARLARTSVRTVIVLTEHPEAASALAGEPPPGVRVEFRQSDGHPHGERRRLVRPARAWARDCWRGGLGNATAWDEVCSSIVLAGVMDEARLDAALVLGADWCAIDPTLTDAIIARYLEAPARQPFVFSPAAPGLAPVLLGRDLVAELARREGDAPLLASMAGLTGYLPAAPVVDPIAKSFCVSPPRALRDAGARCIADTPEARRALGEAFAAAGGDPADTPSDLLARHLRRAQPPSHVVLELCTGRLTSGRRAVAFWGGDEPRDRGPLDTSLARRVIDELAQLAPHAALTFGGAGDPLLHAGWAELTAHARRAGLGAIHLRTDLVTNAEPDALLASGADVLSVDLLADSAEVYRSVAGADYFAAVRERVERLVRLRDALDAPTWIVPRIARLEPALDEIERFYDRWLLGAGAAVIDPAPGCGDGSCVPLPLPDEARSRLDRTTLHVLADGTVALASDGWRRPRVVADLRSHSLAEAWRRARRAARGHDATSDATRADALGAA